MYYNNNCHNCVNKRDIPGDAHISCANPSMFIKGDEHGIGVDGFFIRLILILFGTLEDVQDLLMLNTKNMN